MGVAEEKNIRSGRPGLGNGGLIAGLDAPQMSVRQEDAPPLKGDLLDGEGTVVQPSQLPGTMQMGSFG